MRDRARAHPVLWGEDDIALPPALLDGLEACVPGLHAACACPARRHWIVHEQPGLVAREIEQALARLSAGSGPADEQVQAGAPRGA